MKPILLRRPMPPSNAVSDPRYIELLFVLFDKYPIEKNELLNNATAAGLSTNEPYPLAIATEGILAEAASPLIVLLINCCASVP